MKVALALLLSLAAAAAAPATAEGFSTQYVTGFDSTTACKKDAYRALVAHEKEYGRRPETITASFSVVAFDLSPGATDLVVVCAAAGDVVIATVAGHSAEEDGTRLATVEAIKERLLMIGPAR